MLKYNYREPTQQEVKELSTKQFKENPIYTFHCPVCKTTNRNYFDSITGDSDGGIFLLSTKLGLLCEKCIEILEFNDPAFAMGCGASP